MANINEAFNLLRPPLIKTISLQQCIKYDYSTCPKCRGTNTWAATNDGGSIGFCSDCKLEFKSKPYNSMCMVNKY